MVLSVTRPETCSVEIVVSVQECDVRLFLADQGLYCVSLQYMYQCALFQAPCTDCLGICTQNKTKYMCSLLVRRVDEASQSYSSSVFETNCCSFPPQDSVQTSVSQLSPLPFSPFWWLWSDLDLKYFRWCNSSSGTYWTGQTGSNWFCLPSQLCSFLCFQHLASAHKIGSGNWAYWLSSWHGLISCCLSRSSLWLEFTLWCFWKSARPSYGQFYFRFC